MISSTFFLTPTLITLSSLFVSSITGLFSLTCPVFSSTEKVIVVLIFPALPSFSTTCLPASKVSSVTYLTGISLSFVVTFGLIPTLITLSSLFVSSITGLFSLTCPVFSSTEKVIVVLVFPALPSFSTTCLPTSKVSSVTYLTGISLSFVVTFGLIPTLTTLSSPFVSTEVGVFGVTSPVSLFILYVVVVVVNPFLPSFSTFCSPGFIVSSGIYLTTKSLLVFSTFGCNPRLITLLPSFSPVLTISSVPTGFEGSPS